MADARKIDPRVVNLILFGAGEKRRYSQDTPIIPDVWQQIAADPNGRHDLLITPLDSHSSVEVMMEIVGQLSKAEIRKAAPAPLQSFVAMKLTFAQIVAHLLPLTEWVHVTAKNFASRAKNPDWHLSGPVAFSQVYRSAGGAGIDENKGAPILRGPLLDSARVLTLIAVIRVAQEGGEIIDEIGDLLPLKDEIALYVEQLAAALMLSAQKPSLIWRVASNRKLETATVYSRGTCKADAAARLFAVNCETITWGVIDSGIHCDHPAFMVKPADGGPARSRVIRTYNLGILRELLNVAYRLAPKDNPILAPTAEAAGLTIKQAADYLGKAYQSYTTKILDWSSIEPLLRVKKPSIPTDGHGTHVAGIIGADWWEEEPIEADDDGAPDTILKAKLIGMCPDINLMDFRILGEGLDETEFAVIGALQLVRYLNSHNRHIVVHGVNLSLSIPHEVENYACGGTPVCDECNRLVGADVTVVTAAGNQGYQKFKTEKGQFASYSAFSITDPGNAESVITVGATHRREPHTYGVSYFSSRGPTGDGRMKPDLVAPGERILSTLPDGESGPLDGTSQAAPHVSAAAAMLMARYPELNRNPRRIKQILCESATDLGRERAFQGHGLLDILRALQSY